MLPPFGNCLGASSTSCTPQTPTAGSRGICKSTDRHSLSLVLTDTQARPQYGADWGDYISFTQHLRDKADADGSDLLLIDTGDRVDGSGLYDASDPKGKFTRDVYRYQPIDIITTGNHE